MLYKLWRILQLFLPYGLIIQLYKYNKSLPANIRTRTGKQLKAIMITETYGIIFTQKEYIENRVKYLRQKQTAANNAINLIAQEMNSLSNEARELFFKKEEDEISKS